MAGQKETAGNRVSLEKQRFNNMLTNWAIIIAFAMSMLYLTDLNSVIISVVAGFIVFCYNGIGGFAGWEVLMIEVIAAYVKIGLGVIFMAASFLAFWGNCQQKV